VLDGQLQDAVKQIDHQFGVIAAIDRQKSSKSKSQQLADALLAGTPIIVVTIQTFPYAMEAIVTDKTLKGKTSRSSSTRHTTRRPARRPPSSRRRSP
jgi:type I restriction enzyme R subunit